jgi:hypothetical protein
MKSNLFIPLLLLFCLPGFAEDSLPPSSHSRDFMLKVLNADMKEVRSGFFVPSLVEPRKRQIKRSDPGATGHFTVLFETNLLIRGANDSLERLLNSPGNIVFLYQNTDMLDTSKYLTLIADSISAAHFISRINKVRKREWELNRIVLHPKGTNLYYTFYLRFQLHLLTAKLPKKGRKENFAIKSISPAIPVIHLGNSDDPTRQFGPGLSFNFGLVPVRPLRRLAADIIGPLSLEWMFQPVSSLSDALEIRSVAVGIFFNSFYGILHWGIAWYTPTYCRAEAYIGINFAPAVQLLQGGKTQRYRW